MAGQPLRLSPRLLPFRQLGLKFILQDEPVTEVRLQADRAPENTFGRAQNQGYGQNSPAMAKPGMQQPDYQQNARPQQNFNTAPQSGARSGGAQPPAYTQGQAASQGNAQAKSRPQNQASQSRQGAGDRPPQQKAQNSNAVFRPEPEFKLWPPLWRKVFLKGAPQPAPVVWTYPELGLDLLSQGNPVRSRFFRGLIQELALPKGGNAFWPCALPEETSAQNPAQNQVGAIPPSAASESGAATPNSAPESAKLAYNPAIFMSGLAYIRPKIILIFGRDCLATIFAGTNPDLKNINDFQQAIVFGAKILLLPPITELQDNPDKAAGATPFIRLALAGVFS